MNNNNNNNKPEQHTGKARNQGTAANNHTWHCTHTWESKKKVKVKVKQSHYRHGQAQRVLRKLRFPDFMTTAQGGGKVVSLTHRQPLSQEIPLVLISVRGWVDPKAIVQSEGFYVNGKFQWHQLGSNQRPSDAHRFGRLSALRWCHRGVGR